MRRERERESEREERENRREEKEKWRNVMKRRYEEIRNKQHGSRRGITNIRKHSPHTVTDRGGFLPDVFESPAYAYDIQMHAPICACLFIIFSLSLSIYIYYFFVV